VKIFTDDPLVKYCNTTVSDVRTREEIDAKLREYDVVDIAWHWKPTANDVYVQFGIEEIINEVPIKVVVKVVCPMIWNKANRNAKIPERRTEHVNLEVGMRAMFWYIKSHLETAYAMQSSRVAGFLPDIITHNGRTYFDSVLNRITDFAALPEPTETVGRKVEVVKQQPRNITNL